MAFGAARSPAESVWLSDDAAPTIVLQMLPDSSCRLGIGSSLLDVCLSIYFSWQRLFTLKLVSLFYRVYLCN